MKPKEFEIRFDSPQGVFTAGSNVGGTVLLSLEQPMKIKSIKVFFVGKAMSQWVVPSGKSKLTYRSDEPYFHTHAILYEPDSESGSVHPPGNHAYPFSFQLADALPSSFEGSRGHVRYFCKATIERPWAFDNHVKRAFTVIHHLDLSFMPSVSIPVSEQATEEVYGCCGSAGSVDIHLHLNKTGFVPGEPIFYTVTVQNRSKKTINEVGLVLTQITTYTGVLNHFLWGDIKEEHKKTQPFYLLYTRNCNFKPNTSKQIQKAIAMPSLPPSKLEGCSIIDIKYSLKFKVVCGTTISVEKDIVIGTIPTQPQDSRLSPEVQATPSAPVVAETPSIDAPPSYAEVLAPPPSYAECVQGRTTVIDDDEDTNISGDNSWVPSYPYYDFSSRSHEAYGGQPLEEMTVGQLHEVEDDANNDTGYDSRL